MQASSAICRVVFGALASVSCAAPAFAQEVDSDYYDGRWSVRVEGDAGGWQSARLVIANYGGTWHDTSRNKAVIPRPCRGKKFAVTVQRSVPSEFQFTVFGSSISSACPDLAVVVKPTSPKVLEGSIGASGKIRLERR